MDELLNGTDERVLSGLSSIHTLISGSVKYSVQE